MKPMRTKKDFLTGQLIVTERQMQDIWSNIAAIYSINSIFLEQLLPAKDASSKLIESLVTTSTLQPPKISLTTPKVFQRTSSYGSMLKIPTDAYLDEVIAFIAESEDQISLSGIKGETIPENNQEDEIIDHQNQQNSDEVKPIATLGDSGSIIEKPKPKKKRIKAKSKSPKSRGRKRRKDLKFSTERVPKLSVNRIARKETSENLSEFSRLKPTPSSVTKNSTPQEIISSAFIESAQFFKNYLPYCNNQTNAMETLEDLCKNSQFEAFLQERADIVPACRNLTLKDMIIKPVQRICKYPLLLRVCICIFHSKLL